MPLGSPKVTYSDGPPATPLVTTAETIVATINGVDPTQEADQVILEGSVNVTAGVGATAVTLRVRRGGLAGPVCGVAQAQTIAAGNSQLCGLQVSDVPGEGLFSYVLTVQQSAATGNGTSVAASLQGTY